MFSCLPAPETNKDNRSNFFLETSVIHKRFFFLLFDQLQVTVIAGFVKKFLRSSPFLTKINVFSYRKTLNINPGLIHDGNYIRRAYKRNHFVSGVFHTYYFYLKKEQWNKTKQKNVLTSKCHFTISQQTKHVVSFTIRDH